MEETNVTVDVSFLVGNLTMNINKVTKDIADLQKLISKNIILDKRHAGEFVMALKKLSVKIYECSIE